MSPGVDAMTQWERFDKAMKSIMSVPPGTAEAIRRRKPGVQVPRTGQFDEPSAEERRCRSGKRAN